MFARFFIDRPIFAWVLSLVIILVGGVAALFLPVDVYPSITPPTVQVTASYPGANAQVVADTVAAPIEEQVNGVENMLYMSSQSTNDGAYTLTVTFEIGTDPNMAQVLVQNRVALAMPQLPATVQLEGVSTKKTMPNILLAVNLVSPKHVFDPLYMSNYATIHIVDELARLKGVGNVTQFGVRSYSMRIWLDPDKLAARNLTAVDVVNAVKAQNIQVAAGAIGQEPVPPGQQVQLTISTLGQLHNVRQFGDIILKTGTSDQAAQSEAPGPQMPAATATTSETSAADATASVLSTPVVRVRDVATVEMGAQNYDQIVKVDGEPSTGIAVFQLPGSNALDVADAIKHRMDELSLDFPTGLEYRIVHDTTPYIRQSVQDVFTTLLEAILLVALVVLLFLQDWKAMILPMIDVPVSLVGTFAVMALLGFTLNNLTLFGLVLAIGIVVDDAIVVLENIERLIGSGLDARTATIKAMDEITGPIVAITLVLCSVFLPSVLVPGLTGQFYRQFAVTIAVAMIISAVNAMTLTPSRAVSIFQTEERSGVGGQRSEVGSQRSEVREQRSEVGGRRSEGNGQSQTAGGDLRKEALPWWFFGILGGCLTVWLGRKLLPGFWPSAATLAGTNKWMGWGITAGYAAVLFVPGALGGALVGWLIIRPVNATLGWMFRGFNRFFDRVTEWYGAFVARLLRLSAIVLIAYLGLLVLTGWRVQAAPKGFIPTQDQGYLLVNIQLPDAASVQRTEAIMERIAKIAQGDPNDRKNYPGVPGVAHTVSISGESFVLAVAGSNLGSMFVVLEDYENRTDSAQYDAVVAQRIQERCDREIEGAVVSVLRAPPIRGLGNAGGFMLQVEQRGYVDLPELQVTTDRFVAQANTDQRFRGVFTLFRAATPQLYLDIDRAKVESLQVPIQDVFTTLQADMGGIYVNQFVQFGRTWQVQIQAGPRYRTSPAIVKDLQVRNSAGRMVPLGTVARVNDSIGPMMVMRYNMYASAAINGNPAPGVSSGDVIAAVNDLAQNDGIKFEWTQMTYLEVQAGNVALLIFALGTVMVYLVLAAKYESWRLPLAVILVVPLCMLAATTGMLIARLPVDIFVQIGLLVLVGLASKNAILIVEYAKQLHDEGKDRLEAAVEASKIRFRPIIMTSLAFILGVVPLVLASGAGAEMRQSLGTAVFSGMIGVTLFGIFLTPVFYYVLMWFERRRRAAPAAHGSAPAPWLVQAPENEQAVRPARDGTGRPNARRGTS